MGQLGWCQTKLSQAQGAAAWRQGCASGWGIQTMPPYAGGVAIELLRNMKFPTVESQVMDI